MQKSKFKIIYSLRVHLELRKRGFKSELEMKNPHNANFNCWAYIRTPELMEELDRIVKGE